MLFQFLDNYVNSLAERCTEHETDINTDLNIFYKNTDVSILKVRKIRTPPKGTVNILKLFIQKMQTEGQTV